MKHWPQLNQETKCEVTMIYTCSIWTDLFLRLSSCFSSAILRLWALSRSMWRTEISSWARLILPVLQVTTTRTIIIDMKVFYSLFNADLIFPYSSCICSFTSIQKQFYCDSSFGDDIGAEAVKINISAKSCCQEVLAGFEPTILRLINRSLSTKLTGFDKSYLIPYLIIH